MSVLLEGGMLVALQIAVFMVFGVIAAANVHVMQNADCDIWD
jgi:hypothetical protein